uniref:RNA-directed DNA polymerase n=1 Tax=Anopheles melas TaxID=34690 RepID=A0A182UIV2_9DIPT
MYLTSWPFRFPPLVVDANFMFDYQLRLLYQSFTSSWKRVDFFSPEMACYQRQHKSIKLTSRCILLDNRVIVPRHLRTQCLETFHRGHAGYALMHQQAVQFLYWPTMDYDIVEFIRACAVCDKMMPSVPRNYCSLPWMQFIVRIFPLKSRFLLVAVDTSSLWAEVVIVMNKRATAIVGALRSMFSRFGLPKLLLTDLEDPFNTTYFQSFCQEEAISHEPSTPIPNCPAEHFITGLTCAIPFIHTTGQTLSAAVKEYLEIYRSTPCAFLPGNRSPAAVLLAYPPKPKPIPSHFYSAMHAILRILISFGPLGHQILPQPAGPSKQRQHRTNGH